MTLLAQNVDLEKCEIYNARLCNRKSRNKRIFTDAALKNIAVVGEGKPIMLDEHFQTGVSKNMGAVKGLYFKDHSVSCEVARLLKTHPATETTLERANDEEFSRNCGFSVEIDEGQFEAHMEDGWQVVTSVQSVSCFVLATHTGNTNSIFETKEQAEVPTPAILPEPKVETMSTIETAGDVKATYPKQVAELELAAKTEAEASIATEIATLKEELEALKKTNVELEGQVSVFEAEKKAAQELEEQIGKEAEIEQKMTAAGCCGSCVSENNNLIKKYAAIGDDELTDKWVSSIAETQKRSGGGLRDNVDQIAETSSFEEIVRRRRKQLEG